MFSIADARRAALRARYAEPHRAYHGQAHVDALLRGLRDALPAGATAARAAALEIAVWYHDAVYDPAAADNEARSAALLRAEWDGLLDPRVLDPAEAMIRATAGHALPADLPEGWRGDVALFLDLDLSVLGAAAADYDAYEAGIAAEYAPLHGPDAYRAGRAAFLRGLLGRPRLFHTDRFHGALDGPARANLRRALASLGGT